MPLPLYASQCLCNISLYYALACQSFARPLHFLCMTPPICTLLCLCKSLPSAAILRLCFECCAVLVLSQRFPTMPLQFVACPCLTSPLLVNTVRCILGRCESMSNNAVPLLHAMQCGTVPCRRPANRRCTLPLLCCSNQHPRTSQSFTGSLCRSFAIHS